MKCKCLFKFLFNISCLPALIIGPITSQIHAETSNNFVWYCEQHAEELLLEEINTSLQVNPFIVILEKNLLEKTSTRLLDWMDHIVCVYDVTLETKLKDAGFTLQETTNDSDVYRHLGAQLPAVVLNKNNEMSGIALSVESIADFQLAHNLTAPVEGTLFSGYRKSCVNNNQGVCLWVVERKGTLSIIPEYESPEKIVSYLQCLEKWKNRPRGLEDENMAYDISLSIAQELVDTIGKNRAACAVLEVERQYWQNRNTAGQLQKNRQDTQGMGWANHDHHTFRSSRKHFSKLIQLFEILGFHCREHFYAGDIAGWGAQVMENPSSKLTLFLDVDLAPDEIIADFSHTVLEERDQLGTIGLWCALHGDSFLKSGMHHLESQFMFDNLQADLAVLGIKMMNPFSNFPYLKQAFTAAEIWEVDPKRIQKLVDEGMITSVQGEKFIREGAIGSHLENLQRNYGFKGFNSKNVSSIIKETDPRNSLAE